MSSKNKLMVKLITEKDVSPKALRIGIFLIIKRLKFSRNTVIGGTKVSDNAMNTHATDTKTGLKVLQHELSQFEIEVTTPQLSRYISELVQCGVFLKEVRKPKGSKFEKKDTSKRIILKLNEKYLDGFSV
jgi:hypothetical protein